MGRYAGVYKVNKTTIEVRERGENAADQFTQGAKRSKRISARYPHDDVASSNGLFKQPTAAEVSRLTLLNLRDFRFETQEGHNHFANLLNRGSSQE